MAKTTSVWQHPSQNSGASHPQWKTADRRLPSLLHHRMRTSLSTPFYIRNTINATDYGG